jgi:hypothetical protein
LHPALEDRVDVVTHDDGVIRVIHEPQALAVDGLNEVEAFADGIQIHARMVHTRVEWLEQQRGAILAGDFRRLSQGFEREVEMCRARHVLQLETGRDDQPVAA